MLTENNIYLGDCLDLMKQAPAEGYIITDPPFNVGYHYESKDDNRTQEEYQELFKPMKGKKCVIINYPEIIIRDIVPVLGAPEKCVSWVYNANTPRQHRMIAWFNCKPDFAKLKQPAKNISDKRVLPEVRLYDWWEIQQVKNVSEDKTEHPCQVPIEIMKRIILITTEKNDIIIEPFLGSGTTVIAAYDTGRKYIGIEKEPKYFDIAKKRIEQFKAQGRLF